MDGTYSRILAIPLLSTKSSKVPKGAGHGSPPALLGSENTSPNAKILCMRTCDTIFFLRSINRNCSLKILKGWPVRRLVYIEVFRFLVLRKKREMIEIRQKIGLPLNHSIISFTIMHAVQMIQKRIHQQRAQKHT